MLETRCGLGHLHRETSSNVLLPLESHMNIIDGVYMKESSIEITAFIVFVLVCMCVCLCVNAHTTARMWRSEDHLYESVLLL